MATPAILKRLGDHIRALREALTDLSQERFANFIHLDRTHYTKIECGRINVSVLTLEVIARGLGVPLRDLFDFPAPKKRRG